MTSDPDAIPAAATHDAPSGHGTPPAAPPRGFSVTRRLFLPSLVVTVLTAILFFPLRHSERIEATKVCYTSASTASAALGHKMQNVVASTVDLAALMERESLEDSALYSLLRGIASSDSDILEVGIGYRRDMAPQESGLHAPHHGIREGQYQDFRVDSFYDYTTHSWFLDGLRKGSHWFRPYFGKATQSWVVGYVVPIRAPGAGAGEYPAGVARINYSLPGITRIVDRLPLGRSGTAFVVSRHGQLITHPNVRHIESGCTLAELGGEIGRKTVEDLEADIRLFELSSHVYRDPLHGKVNVVIQQPIPSTDWALVTIFDVDEVARTGEMGRLLGILETTFRVAGVVCVLSLLWILAPWFWQVLKDSSSYWEDHHPGHGGS